MTDFNIPKETLIGALENAKAQKELQDLSPDYEAAVDIDGNDTVDTWEQDAFSAGLNDKEKVDSFTAWFGGEDGKLSEDEYNKGKETTDLNKDGVFSSNELYLVNKFATTDVQDREKDKANFALSEGEAIQLNTFYTTNTDAVESGEFDTVLKGFSNPDSNEN
jgi:hypothetical protein